MGIAALLILLLADGSFAAAAESLTVVVRIRSDLGMRLSKQTLFEHNGTRMILIALLMSIIIIGIVVSAIGILADESGRLWIIPITTTCLATAIVIKWKVIVWHGFFLRMKFRSTRLCSICSEVLRKWPDISEAIGRIGLNLIAYDTSTPNLIGVEPLWNSNSYFDRFGPIIYRNGDIVIIDTMTDLDWKLVYCERELLLQDCELRIEGLDVVCTAMEIRNVSDKLSLVKYDVTEQQIDEKGDSQ
jgi:hypothetical protein